LSKYFSEKMAEELWKRFKRGEVGEAAVYKGLKAYRSDKNPNMLIIIPYKLSGVEPEFFEEVVRKNVSAYNEKYSLGLQVESSAAGKSYVITIYNPDTLSSVLSISLFLSSTRPPQALCFSEEGARLLDEILKEEELHKYMPKSKMRS